MRSRGEVRWLVWLLMMVLMALSAATPFFVSQTPTPAWFHLVAAATLLMFHAPRAAVFGGTR